MEENFSCGERLKELRRKAGFSQEGLALRAELSTVYIGMIERGQKSPTVRVLEQLCQALGVTLSDFFYPCRRDRPAENALEKSLRQLSPSEQQELLEIVDQIIRFKREQP